MKIKYYILTIAAILINQSVLLAQLNRLDEKTAFTYFLKISKQNRKDFSTEYMFQFQNEIYEKYWNDEFDFHEKKEASFNKLMADISTIDTDKEYAIFTTSEFGEYNFENNTFVFSPFKYGTVFSIVDDPSSYSCKKCKTFTDIDLQLLNATDVTQFKIESSAASSLIKSRKSSSGSVDRDVAFMVYFKLTSTYSDDNNEKEHDAIIDARITKIEVYDMFGYNSKKGTQQVISTINMSNLSKNEAPDKEENPEIENLISYIQGSLIDNELKNQLIELIKQNQ